ncbi:related to phosphoglycerate mutase [Rhynchosporium graminicola]|uniref:Related to phosphoglycerate mutase n=1 Tax=Rhynchosporium graminicola TaxID=2792576 RepID=A0A1E1K0D4_9HELO|nr:related to phosphoglycerate mutase [Rhynchosporium commune]
MSDANATTPRVFIARHGETEWTINGRCTGNAEIPLTEHGIAQVQGTSEALVGAGKLIDPSKLVHVFSSPRQRALVTLDMLLGKEHKKRLQHEGKITVTESITEWDYGNYEGLTPLEIKESRAKSGLPKWDIWTMGCDGGESAEAVQERLDKLIGEIYELQKPHMDGKSGEPADVLIVAHGHILRAFTKRWLLYSMKFPFTMMMEPGAIGIMSYAHHNVDEPAILVGMAFPRPT